MTLLSPALLWTLVALLPLAAIYFLKVRPRKKPVTAYFLWQKVFSENKASALFKRLRDVLSLLLLAVAFAAVALALAEPDFAGDERKDLLLVVDNSASMSTLHGGSSRLQRAKARATDLIRGMNGSQRAAVASFAGRTTILTHPTRHRRSLLDAVEGIQPTQMPSRMNALHHLQPGEEWMRETRVILLTDGCLDADVQPATVEIIRISDEAENIGIGRADLQPLSGGQSRLGLFIQPVVSLNKPLQTDLVLTHLDTGKAFRLIPLTLSPGTNASLTLALDDAPTGRWKAEFSHADALPLDNAAWFYVPPRDPVPVLVQADDPYFFKHAVLAFGRSDQLLSMAPDLKSARLVLGTGKIPDGVSAVLFHPSGEEMASPVPRVVVKDHPLLRFLDPETMNFTGARKVAPPAGAVVLVRDEGGTPLIYLSRQGEHSLCVVNMDPVASQFYLSAWFPVLIRNAVTHLTHRTELPPSTLPTGSTVLVPGQEKLHGPLQDTGFHPAGNWTLAVSLVSPQESLINQNLFVENLKPISSGESPSYWLLVLAISILVGESVLYHRRKVG